MSLDLESIKHNTAVFLDEAMKIEPTIASVAGALIPGAAPIVMMVQPEIALLIPKLSAALSDTTAANAGDLANGLVELMRHLIPGLENSPVLSPGSTKTA